ncbi:MAG: PilZ domain-containing protein [Desulforhopalus sp.]
MNTKSFHEKRSCPRHRAKDSSAVMLAPGNIISYCLLDVSKSGLSFCYNCQADETDVLNDAILTFFPENGGSTDIAVQIVSDSELHEEVLRSPVDADHSTLPYLRRCGVKFNLSSQAQEDTINAFILNLTLH